MSDETKDTGEETPDFEGHSVHKGTVHNVHDVVHEVHRSGADDDDSPDFEGHVHAPGGVHNVHGVHGVHDKD